MPSRNRIVVPAIVSLLGVLVVAGYRQLGPVRPGASPPIASGEPTTPEEGKGLLVNPPSAIAAVRTVEAQPQTKPKTVTPAADTAPSWRKANVDDLPLALATTFDRESVDARWARETQQQLALSARDVDKTKATVKSIQCRSTMCRVSGELAPEASRSDVGTMVGPQGPFAKIPLAFYAPPSPAGESAFDIYFIRNEDSTNN